MILFLKIDSEENERFFQTSHFRHVFNDDFILRLCRFFMFFLNDERVWRKLHNRLNDNVKSDYFRFNIFINKKIMMNVINQMKDFRQCVQLQFSDHENKFKTAVALLTTIFFFELKNISFLKIEQYECQKFVRCRNNEKTIVDAFKNLFEVDLKFRNDMIILRMLSQKNVCETCQLYCKKITLKVRHLENNINLYIRCDATERRKISEFSHNILWFIQQQQLNTSYDNQTHDFSTWL